MTTYETHYADGRIVSHDSYEGAVAALEAEYEDATIGHDGDLDDGGDRTLVWSSEDDAWQDDGRKSVAKIVRA